MENIMLQDVRKERIKIVDFGLSNIYTRENPLKTHCGSPEYAAPELFVVGKKYGPEVDLWSLGVIFYAMATGELPFQSPREVQTSSEERRRKLLAQINRGLTQGQKKSIATMSSEYRNLVNRLLMPVPLKRITIRELCTHPWIANRPNDLTHSKINQSELLAYEHDAVIEEIAGLTSLERSFIERDVFQARYGEIGGMYNIKAHAMRQRGSLRTLRARSWTRASHQSGYTPHGRSMNETVNSRTDHQLRRSPASIHLNSSLRPMAASTTQRGTVSSSGGMCRAGTWTPKQRKIAASSPQGGQRSSTCPLRETRYTAAPEIHGSGLHRAKLENDSDRRNGRGVIGTSSRKSVAGFEEISPSVAGTRASPEIRQRKSKPTVNRDSVEQWITEKLKILEKQGPNQPRRIPCRPSSSVAAEAARNVRNYRPSPAHTIQTLCKEIRNEESMGQGDRLIERSFYRSLGARTDIGKTRLTLSTLTPSLVKNSRGSRPVTASENYYNRSPKVLGATSRVPISTNKIRSLP